MSYEPKIVQRASARLARRRDIRERKRYMLEQQLYKQEPRLAPFLYAFQIIIVSENICCHIDLDAMLMGKRNALRHLFY